MSRFGKTERMIFTIALLFLLAFSYFLYDDSLLFNKSHSGQLSWIGDVALSQNDVRRKNLDTFSWVPASSKDQVFENDSIYTGDRSEAIINLSGGGQIRVQPNSLITLNMKDGQMTLDLKYGNLVGEIKQGASLTVKSGKEEFKLDGSDKNSSRVQLNKAHSGKVDLKLLKGQVRYSNKKNPSTLQLKKDSALEISAKGDAKPVAQPVLTIESADNIHWTRVNPDDPLPFRWKSQGDVARYELEISPEQNFASVAVSQHTSTGKIEVRDPLADGAYYWRVKALDKSGNVGAVSKPYRMSLTNLGAPQIVEPVAHAEISQEVLVPLKAVPKYAAELTWQSPELLKNFTWQVSLDSSFSTVLYEGQTAELKIQSPPLGSGSYWVRVRGQTAELKDSAWSAPVPFTLNLIAKHADPPAAPILITKHVQFQIPTGKDRNPASPQSPQLAWKPVQRSQGYRVEVAKEDSFARKQTWNVSKTDTLWSQYRPGKYFYRVFARGEGDVLSASSDIGTIEIPFSPLVLNPVRGVASIGSENGPKETAVSWSEVPSAKSYVVQVDQNQNFVSPTKQVYNDTQGRIVLPTPGRYNVRVQALDEKNNPVTEFSNVQQVVYANRPPLTAPQLVEPLNNASIFLQTAGEPFIWLEWRKVPGAANYRIEMSDSPDFSRLVLSKSVSGNRYLVKERIPLGKLYWRVRAEIPEELEISAWAKQNEFTLYHQKNETFVK